MSAHIATRAHKIVHTKKVPNSLHSSLTAAATRHRHDEDRLSQRKDQRETRNEVHTIHLKAIVGILPPR